jgi:uncharacterized protein (UPF0335 family)
MTKVKAGPVAGERIKSFIERVEKLLEERHAIQGDIRDVFSEAKGVGYDVKTMRKLIQIRAMDAAARDEANALLDTYAHAIGAEEIVGTFAREPSEEELVDRATKVVREVDRCLLLPRDPLPTIRHIMEEIGCSSGKAHKLRRLVEERLEAMEKFSRSNAATVKCENETPHDPSTGEVIEDLGSPAVAAPIAPDQPTSFATGSAHEGDDDGRSRAGDADGSRGDSGPAPPQRNPGGEGRGDEPVRPDAAHAASLPDAGHGRGCGVAASADSGRSGDEAEHAVASPEIDLTYPPDLAAKRREIDARRAGQ